MFLESAQTQITTGEPTNWPKNENKSGCISTETERYEQHERYERSIRYWGRRVRAESVRYCSHQALLVSFHGHTQ